MYRDKFCLYQSVNTRIFFLFWKGQLILQPGKLIKYLLILKHETTFFSSALMHVGVNFFKKNFGVFYFQFHKQNVAFKMPKSSVILLYSWYYEPQNKGSLNAKKVTLNANLGVSNASICIWNWTLVETSVTTNVIVSLKAKQKKRISGEIK